MRTNKEDSKRRVGGGDVTRPAELTQSREDDRNEAIELRALVAKSRQDQDANLANLTI